MPPPPVVTITFTPAGPVVTGIPAAPATVLEAFVTTLMAAFATIPASPTAWPPTPYAGQTWMEYLALYPDYVPEPGDPTDSTFKRDPWFPAAVPGEQPGAWVPAGAVFTAAP